MRTEPHQGLFRKDTSNIDELGSKVKHAVNSASKMLDLEP